MIQQFLPHPLPSANSEVEVYTRGDAVLLWGAGYLGSAIPGTIVCLADAKNTRVNQGIQKTVAQGLETGKVVSETMQIG